MTIALVAVAAMLAAPSAVLASSLAGTPRVPGGSGRLVRKPALIPLSQDGSDYLSGPRKGWRLGWFNWHYSYAQGEGAEWINNCTPDCARGTYTHYPAAIRLYRPRVLRGHLVFTRLRIHFEDVWPRRLPRTRTLRLS
jgi:hypothetical protein